MYKILPFLAFTVLLLIPVGAQNTFAQVPSPPLIGDFWCYDFEFVPFSDIEVIVNLDDQFGDSLYNVIGPKQLCNFAEKDESPGEFPASDFPVNPNQHFTVYIIAEDLIDPDNPALGVVVDLTDQFGTVRHTVGSPIELWLPTAKLVETTNENFPSPTDFHYKCYDIDPAPFPFTTVTLSDQFNTHPFVFSTTPVTLGDAKKMCTPVVKTLPGGSSSGDKNIPDHLKCYEIVSGGHDASGIGVFLTDQFVDNQFEQISVTNDDEFACFVASKSFPSDIVGGEIIPLDASSLLVDGLQTSAIWLAPIVISAVGIGLVLVRRK